MPESSATLRPSLRVLMIGPLPPPVGGMASVNANLAAALAGRLDLRVLNNVKTTPVDRTPGEAVRAQSALLLALLRILITWRPVVVHIHTCSFGTFWRNGIDVLVARLLGRRVVLHIHGGRFHKFIAGLGRGGRAALRTILGLCQGIVVLGEGWREVLSPWVGDPRRIHVVPNGVPVPPSGNLVGDLQAAPTVLCLASYERCKGQEDLVRALASLPRPITITLRLHGIPVEAGEQERITALVEALGVGSHVRVSGPVTGADKDRAMRDCAAFCLPSHDEGLPMAMLEAMAFARPVIVTRVGSIPEVITNGRDGLLVAPGDQAAFAGALARVAGADPALAAMGRAGRTLVEKRYAVSLSADRLLDLWERLAGGAPGRDCRG